MLERQYLLKYIQSIKDLNVNARLIIFVSSSLNCVVDSLKVHVAEGNHPTRLIELSVCYSIMKISLLQREIARLIKDLWL